MKVKKLRISKETLRQLSMRDLARLHGRAGGTVDVTCDSCITACTCAGWTCWGSEAPMECCY